MTEYENTSEQYEVWQNKVDPSIAWVAQPGYKGSVENDVLDSRWHTINEAQERADTLYWEHTTEDNRNKLGGSLEGFLDVVNDVREDYKYIQLNNWVRDIYDNTAADPNDWDTNLAWATEEVEYFIEHSEDLPGWFEDTYKRYMIDRLVHYASSEK